MTTQFRPEQCNLTKYWNFGSGTMRVPAGGAFPGGPNDGDMYYRTDEDMLYIYDGAGWESVSGRVGLTDIAWHVDGALAVATEVGEARLLSQSMTFTKAYIYSKVTGTANSTIVDIHLNGVTIYTNQGNRPTLAWNDPDKKAVSAAPDVTAGAEGDILTIDIDAIATGVEDLVIVLCFEAIGGMASHAILDGVVHTDSDAQGVTQGSLIVGSASPLWTELVIGAAGRLLRSNGTDPAWTAIKYEKTFTFGVPGDLAVGAIAVRLHAPRGGTITNVTATVDTAPTDADIIVDVNKAGVTIFTTQGNRPTIADGTNDDLASVPDITAFNQNDLFTIDIDQVGATVVGADLVVQIRTTVEVET